MLAVETVEGAAFSDFFYTVICKSLNQVFSNSNLDQREEKLNFCAHSKFSLSIINVCTYNQTAGSRILHNTWLPLSMATISRSKSLLIFLLESKIMKQI